MSRRLAAALALVGTLALAGPPALAAPLSLEAGLATAVSKSGSLLARQLDERRAGAAVREARARALPQLSLVGSGSYMTVEPEGITIPAGSFATAPMVIPQQDVVLMEAGKNTYFKVEASLDQVLFTWGKISRAVELARLDLKAAGIETEAGRRALVRDFSRAYFGALLARESASLLGEASTIMDGILRDRQSAFEAGTVTKAEVLDTAAQAAQFAYQALKARESLATGLEALGFWLGSTPAAESLVTPFRDTAPPLDEVALTRAALGSSTEIAGLSVKAGQARLARQIRQASLAGLPDLSLNVTYDLSGQDIPFDGGDWTDGYSGNLVLTLGMKVTLFDSLSSLWRLREAQAQEAAAEAGLDELSRSQGLQVRRLVEALRSGAALVVRERAGAELAAERARNAALALQNEAITRAEEGGARVGDISARLSLVLARYQTELAFLDLEYATGRSLSAP